MLLLLLGIIVLHVAVLVLLFVSTIVSVSARRSAGAGGAGSAGVVMVVVVWLPGGDFMCAPSTVVHECMVVCRREVSDVPERFAVPGNLPLFSFEKTTADSGVGRKQSLD